MSKEEFYIVAQKRKGRTRCAFAIRCFFSSLLCAAVSAGAQTTASPVTESAAQASPAASKTVKTPAVESAAQASPEAAAPAQAGTGLGSGARTHTAIVIRLEQDADSGHLKNGQNIHASLISAVHLTKAHYAAGTPVELSVIATVPAGKLGAAGEFSLQLLRVGKTDVYTETQTFHGKPGHRDLPDSAAEIGMNAGLSRGSTLTFHVQPPPSAAATRAPEGAGSPGSITARVSGSQGVVDASASAASGKNRRSAKAPDRVVPANTTSTPIQGASPTQPR